MHIKYCYLLKLTRHAGNILGADCKGRCSTHLPQWDSREMWGMCPMDLCPMDVCPQAVCPIAVCPMALMTPGWLPGHHSVPPVQFHTPVWGWLSGHFSFLCSYFQLTLCLGCLQGPWRVCALVWSADKNRWGQNTAEVAITGSASTYNTWAGAVSPRGTYISAYLKLGMILPKSSRMITKTGEVLLQNSWYN